MTYAEHHRRLIDYLEAKVAAADWHGVSDAANDLRVLEAQECQNAPHPNGCACAECREKVM